MSIGARGHGRQVPIQTRALQRIDEPHQRRAPILSSGLMCVCLYGAALQMTGGSMIDPEDS